MEISHASLETSVASLGIKGQAEEVTVSTDAEFMMMIAHGIYSNKALALIRELLCNARDGHMKAGWPDKPIIVTLTDNLLVIRDHGTGIPNAIFARTYMTFGQSTKRKDKLATGGFGVGTKVPWAVCDTFSARNWIDKTMTAYSIVKSDPMLGGKPSCTPVMTIPSVEPSGVEVSVPFPEKMHSEISVYLRHFADELGIPLIINGTPHTSWKLEEIAELYEKGFTYSASHPKTVIQSSPFYVRQGDVIYPIEQQEEFNESWAILKNLSESSIDCFMFLAEPDSIIPTLSRESLQYTDRTILSIKKLMNKVIDELASNLDAYAKRTEKHLPQYISNSTKFVQKKWNDRYDILLDLSECHAAFLRDDNLSNSQNLLLHSNMRRWLVKHTPYLETKTVVGADFRNKMNNTVLSIFKEKLKQFKHLDHKRLLELSAETPNGWKKSQQFLKNVARDSYEEFMFWRAEIEANPDLIEVYISKSVDFQDVAYSSSISRNFIELTNLKNFDTRKQKFFTPHTTAYETHYVSKLVVISTNIITMLGRAREKLRTEGDVQSPLAAGCMAYLLGAKCLRVKATMKPPEIDKLKKQIEDWGYTVLVLMEPTADELEERKRLAEERASLKGVKLPFLHELISTSDWGLDAKQRTSLKKKLNALAFNPEFKGEPLYFALGKGSCLPREIRTVSQYFEFVRLIGNDVLCVSTKADIQKAIKAGRKDVETAVLEFVRWFYKQPTIHEKLFYQGSFLAQRAAQNKYLTKYLFNRLPPKLTEQEEKIYGAIQQFSRVFQSVHQYVAGRNTYFNSCRSRAERQYRDLFEKYAESHFCDVYRVLEAAFLPEPSPQRVLARSILKSILKG